MNLQTISEQKKSYKRLEEEELSLAERRNNCEADIARKEDIFRNLEKNSDVRVDLR
jgi:hypothetical protein